MKNRLLIPLFVFFLLHISCQNDATGETQNKQDDTSAQQSASSGSDVNNVAKIYCLIDGHQWQGGAINGSYIEDRETGLTIVDIAGIAPIKNNVDFTTMINLQIKDFKGMGNYNDNVVLSLKKIFRDQSNMEDMNTANCRLEVTAWDETNRIISGHFSAHFPKRSNKFIPVEEGQFENVTLNSIVVE